MKESSKNIPTIDFSDAGCLCFYTTSLAGLSIALLYWDTEPFPYQVYPYKLFILIHTIHLVFPILWTEPSSRIVSGAFLKVCLFMGYNKLTFCPLEYFADDRRERTVVSLIEEVLLSPRRSKEAWWPPDSLKIISTIKHDRELDTYTKKIFTNYFRQDSNPWLLVLINIVTLDIIK